MDRLRQLIHEIHRRSLWQVLGIYLAGSVAVLGGAGTLADLLRLPDWFVPLAFGILVVGLPIVLATAFVQEGGPGHEPSSSETRKLDEVAEAQRFLTWRNAFGAGVLAFALWGVVAAGWVLFGAAAQRPVGDDPGIEPSIAVMPCEDLTSSGDQAELGQGIAEGIINALARLPDLKVSGITSVVALRQRDADVRSVAEALDVATVLECGLQQAQQMIRIRPRLVEAATGTVLWADEMDRPSGNVFAIQDEVAQAVADRLQVMFASGAEAPLVAHATPLPEAHQAYMRGRYLLSQRTGTALQSAIAEFERATQLDRNYADAYSGLADAYLLLDFYITTLDERTLRENLTRGRQAAETALSLAPERGIVRTSSALSNWMGGSWEEAEREFEQAVALSPGYSAAHHWYAQFLWGTGRAREALQPARRALELDPVSQINSADLGFVLSLIGRTEASLEQFRDATAIDPGRWMGWFFLSQGLLEAGQYDEGLEAWESYVRVTGADRAAMVSAYQAAARAHETSESQELPVFGTTPGSPGVGGWLYARAGHADGALDFIRTFVESGAYGVAAFFHVWWGADLLGDDLRYQALLEEAGITW